MNNLDELIAKEQHRRARLNRQRRPYHHWQESGDPQPPPVEHWCEYCVGFYGVPHDNIHINPFTKLQQLCPQINKAMAGQRQCVCIDCVCAEQISGPGSLASRITQA